MKIAVTGATGFIGRYLVTHLAQKGYKIRAWKRASSDISGLPGAIEWQEGSLTDHESIAQLVDGVDKVVHAAVYRPSGGWSAKEGELPEYLETNFMGSIHLLNEAVKRDVQKFVFVSTCAVHDKILPDRKLDEAHPLWAKSHYGAHKAAIEKFIHSFGYGVGRPFCAVRPTGVYGVKHDVKASKWFPIIESIVRGEDVTCSRGGKEVHVLDVVKAISLLLDADGVSGESYNCYDRYISEYDVAQIASKITGSKSVIEGESMAPKNQIDNSKIVALGMSFGGTELCESTVSELIEHCTTT